MLRADFLNELRRLYRGSRCEVELTDERIAALWERYQYEPLPRFREAVSICLLEPAKPTVSRLEAALRQVEDREAKRNAAKARQPVFIQRDTHTEWDDYDRFRMKLLLATMSGEYQPSEIGAMLREAMARFPIIEETEAVCWETKPDWQTKPAFHTENPKPLGQSMTEMFCRAVNLWAQP